MAMCSVVKQFALPSLPTSCDIFFSPKLRWKVPSLGLKELAFGSQTRELVQRNNASLSLILLRLHFHSLF